MIKLGFIGTGTIGSALALQLNRRRYPVVAVASRRHTSAEQLAELISGCRAVSTNQAVADMAELVFISTPDDMVASVAKKISWRPEHSVVHCSGADTTDTLEAARRAGAQVGVFHPLQSFAQPEQAIANLSGSTFALEATEPLLETLKEMATALEGYWLELPREAKVLYHAAAVIASNYLVTLLKTAINLWQSFGVPADEAVKALRPLVQGTLNNIVAVGIPQCLTGPIARGDTGTITKHLAALNQQAPDTATLYRELGLRTIPIAVAKGKIDQHRGDDLKTILKTAA